MSNAQDMKRVKSLREYYRKNFTNGSSDDCFFTWIEGVLEDIENHVPRPKPIQLTPEERIREILSRPHSPTECPSKGMFGRDCKNCIR